MKKSWLLILFFLLLLAGCKTDKSAQPVEIDPAGIDLATLPDTIDVQTASALQDHEDVLLLDVREQFEYDAGHIPNITLIPMGEVASRLSEIPHDKTIILTCRSGNRSGQVTDFLRDSGYDNVHNMSGGILAWEKAGYEVEK